MHRVKAYFVGGITAITLIAGAATAIATTTDDEEPLPDAPPSWVLPDGSVDTTAIPREAAEILTDGRPNSSGALGPQIPDTPVSTSGTNPPDVISSDPDPADDDEEGTELLEWEVPTVTCGGVIKAPTGGKLVIRECARGAERAADGSVQDTVADGKCITATIRIGTYSRAWKACDGQTVKLDTGFREGAVIGYSYQVA
ncbi:hypothetical protein [Streptomyces sp. NPDC048282]|uniref:hypothetical protein n=1 Tax=Streptomyces sp. NPDC048282 TaxID=3365528 RepID=UPI00371DC719